MSTSVSPDAARIWRAARLPLAIVLILVGTALVTVLVARGDGGALDPGSATERGSRALATLLEGEGVRVERVATLDAAEAAAGGATLLVTEPNQIRPERLAALSARAGRVVLVGPLEEAVAAAAPGLRVAGPVGTGVRPPGCALPAAVAAGSATTGGVGYTGEGARLCYRDGDAGTVASVHIGEGERIALGDPAPLTNAALGEEGNAALAMRLLGQHERLVWYLPSTDDPALRGEQSVYDLLPDGVVFGLVQAAVAVVLLALWRARRLGRVVTEPLPVVVRAAETVEGAARLYRRAGAADHAAAALRGAALARIRPALGLAADAEPAAVVAAVAARGQWTETEVAALLYGPPPAGDAGLVTLADRLDALEREVTRG